MKADKLITFGKCIEKPAYQSNDYLKLDTSNVLQRKHELVVYDISRGVNQTRVNVCAILQPPVVLIHQS
jgi:hypothetical protein